MSKPIADTALVGLSVMAGAALPLQALINGRLGATLGSPFWASVMQNLIGALAMLCLVAALRVAAPSPGQVAAVPAWGWVGGLLGMLFVVSSLIAAPRLGAAPTIAAVICGQLVSALLLDHFGVLHARRPIDLGAVAGVLLLAAGAALILRRA
jgi:transporter family-2 protein